MKKYKGIIFDLDGTLLDTLEDLGDSMNEALSLLGYPTFDLGEYKLKVGGGFRKLAINSLPKDVDENTISKLVNLFAKIYDGQYANKTKPYKGIDELLDELIDNNIILAINSNKKDSYTKILADKFFSRIPFIKVYGEREGVIKKPDPAAAIEIANAMGLNPKEILFIGDSNVDIETAKNAGMDSVGVLWGFRDHKELSSYGATYIVEEAKEILLIATRKL